MASARARLGKARRGIIQRKKQTGVVEGILGTVGTVAAFGAGQAKKADTAWKEYEAGYKELGGDVKDIQKPGFFKRTAQQFLPGGKTGLPEGDVTIGKKIYDREKIQSAGSFLGSDAAAVLFSGEKGDAARTRYLERTAPGRTEATTFTSGLKLGQTGGIDPTMDYTGVDPQEYDALVRSRQGGGVGAKFGGGGFSQNYVTSELASSRTGVYDQKGRIGVAGPDFLQDYQPDLSVTGDTITAADRKETARIQHKQSTGYSPSYSFPQGTPESKGFGGYRPNPGFISYARGGDFITNGPQKILVGDNASGRERVTVKPLPSKKDEAKFGRYGDDDMKMIDGKLAHINSILEKNMSPEDIKKYGSGTINPITGKKEYFLGAIATGLSIGSSLYKGYQATQNKGNVEAGQAAAYDMYQDQLGLLGEQKGIAGQTAQLGFDVTQSQIAAGGRESIMGAQTGMRDVTDFTTTASSKSGLATSGAIQQKAQIGAGDIRAKVKSDMTKLFETRQFAEKERDISLSQADLSYRKGEMSAEEAYESTLTGLEQTPTTFLEGVFG